VLGSGCHLIQVSAQGSSLWAQSTTAIVWEVPDSTRSVVDIVPMVGLALIVTLVILIGAMNALLWAHSQRNVVMLST